MRTRPTSRLTAVACTVVLAAFGGGNHGLPQLPEATGAILSSCTDLVSTFSFANTTIRSAVHVEAGTLKVAGTQVGAHCLVKGEMYRRTSAVDGQSYAIGFEMRLPVAWNGRFFYQANGGIDGFVATATGAVNGGPGLTNALQKGFAVISSDAGHMQDQNPAFGIDPQARLDYGYQAAAKLTPMAKRLIAAAYGKPPDRSYFGGCSNGGRHAMVAMTRLPGEYDGFLAGAPGFRLPLAAIASIFRAQRYATVATNPADLETAFTAAEHATVSAVALAKCDGLDGASDGLIQDTTACQKAFDFNRDVPTCSADRDGTCLTAAQKRVIGPIFSGAVDGSGKKFYASFPFDSGHGSVGVRAWEFVAPLALDAPAVGLIWGVPPANPATFNGPNFALTSSIDRLLVSVAATDSTYAESAISFMLPVQPAKLDRLKSRGAKVIVYHGVSDAIFSVDDTTAWYEELQADNGGDASDFARFFRVPGMDHCSGGPSTDQFDMLTALVKWVEKGQAPDRITAAARGAGNPAGVNRELPPGWSGGRTRPLCPYPKVARLKPGATNLEVADSFVCR